MQNYRERLRVCTHHQHGHNGKMHNQCRALSVVVVVEVSNRKLGKVEMFFCFFVFFTFEHWQDWNQNASGHLGIFEQPLLNSSVNLNVSRHYICDPITKNTLRNSTIKQLYKVKQKLTNDQYLQ